MTEKSQQPDYRLNFRVIGTRRAGKSTFIKTACDRLHNISEYYENARSDIASEFGVVLCEVNNKHIEVQLLSNPPSFHFAHMDVFIREGNFGFIIIIDSANPETFEEEKQIIETFNNYAPCPYIIVANKQDLEEAQEIEKLRVSLRVPDEIPVIPCIATDKQSVAKVLIALCEEVLKDIEEDEQDAPTSTS